MAGPKKTTTAAKRRPTPAPKPAAKRRPPAPKPQPADDRDSLSVADLARGIVSKAIRARALDVRRLAEAVVAGASAKLKKGKKDKAAGEKKKDKGTKKLAKIPGQKAKK
jgi:hypothetical protein